MPFPLVAIAIGAGIGALAGGMSGEDGFDWKRALMGGVLGGATGGIGAAALGPVAAASGGGWMAAGGASTAAGFGAPAASSAAGLASTSAPGLAAMGGLSAAPASGIAASGVGGLSYGMGSQAAAASKAGYLGSGLGSSLGSMGGPGIASVQAPALQSSYASTAGSQGLGYGAPQSSYATPKGKGLDWNKVDLSNVGDATQKSLQQKPAEPFDDRIVQGQEKTGQSSDSSVATELAAAAASMQSPTSQPGLNIEDDVASFSRGRGVVMTPKGSLTGGLLVGPGTGTSDSIASTIFPDVASKLGASSAQNIQGGGHSLQPAALSDGEYVLTAKAVKGFGKKAGAPPGQEREYGSKLLDSVMNQMQRV